MALPLPVPSPNPRPSRRYLRPPVPLHFPVEERVPEGHLHRKLLYLLWASVEHALGDRGIVCSDQFLYWDPTNPKRCLAPDLAVRVDVPRESLDSWKTWEKGAPHLGVEVTSDWDRSHTRLDVKLARYRQAGILEVVRFDAKDAEEPLRLWDLVEGDLVERDRTDPEAFRCDALALYWRIVPDADLGKTLRLAHDAAGTRLLPTPEEAALAEKAALAAEKAALAAEKAALAAEKAVLAAENSALVAEMAALRERSARAPATAEKDATLERALARIAALEAELETKQSR